MGSTVHILLFYEAIYAESSAETCLQDYLLQYLLPPSEYLINF